MQSNGTRSTKLRWGLAIYQRVAGMASAGCYHDAQIKCCGHSGHFCHLKGDKSCERFPLDRPMAPPRNVPCNSSAGPRISLLQKLSEFVFLFLEIGSVEPNEHNTLIRCWVNVWPASQTLATHWSNIGYMSGKQEARMISEARGPQAASPRGTNSLFGDPIRHGAKWQVRWSDIKRILDWDGFYRRTARPRPRRQYRTGARADGGRCNPDLQKGKITSRCI